MAAGEGFEPPVPFLGTAVFLDPVRKRWVQDLNLRYPFRYSGFQDRCVQPLCQPTTFQRGKSPRSTAPAPRHC